ncbi:MAG: type II toxin-antitoxin system Phd/YefM family antitoxin [Paracoccaceae bacterium]
MWTLQDAKNRFSAVVEAAMAGQPQEVSRRGRPAVVIISAEDFARLNAQAQKGRGSFLEHLMSMPALDDEDWLLPDRTRVAPRDIEF